MMDQGGRGADSNDVTTQYHIGSAPARVEFSRRKDGFNESDSIGEDKILKELNNHLSKALSEGNHPQWLCEIKGHDDDTWC